MSLPEMYISCDWGTSNFRLRLVNLDTLEVISEYNTNVGVKKLNEIYKEKDQGKSRIAFFAAYLREGIQQLAIQESTIPIIVASGMITSSIGMLELPYVDMPLNFTGDTLFRKMIVEGDLKIIMVSGAKTATDVMRGEEIQAVGLSKYIAKNENGVLILPGTHSKHLQFKNGIFTTFTTYMTGELFEVIGKNTILKNSILKKDWNKKFEISFLEGVNKGLNHQYLAYLFSLRANDLLGNKTKDENFYFLSGLLIGGELAYLKGSNKHVYIAATGILCKLYELALDQIGKNNIHFDTETMDKALLIGHKKIAESYV